MEAVILQIMLIILYVALVAPVIVILYFATPVGAFINVIILPGMRIWLGFRELFGWFRKS